jgi:CRP-like cAMP-binding protein
VAAENHLLSSLDASTLAVLKPHMRTIAVEHGELLHSSATEIEFAYFPRSCIISVLASTDQGATAETSIVGREGMIGSSTIHGITTSFADSIVQVAGEAVRIPAAEVHRAERESESFRKTVALFDLSLCSRSRSNRPHARHCTRWKTGLRAGSCSAGNGWAATTSA